MDKIKKQYFFSHVNFQTPPRYRAAELSPTIHCGAAGKQLQAIVEIWIEQKP